MPRSLASGSPLHVAEASALDVSAALDPPHERILTVARDLFCRDGIHATGVDRILAGANASKMTLYARFGSKEQLLRQVLLREGAAWRATFRAAVEATASEPRARLAGIAAALGAWFDGDRFYGCAFMNAIAEHTKGEAWLRDLARAHHAEILTFLAQAASDAGSPEPALLARQLLLLIDGVIAALMVSGDRTVLEVAARNLDAVLAAALPPEAGQARAGALTTQ